MARLGQREWTERSLVGMSPIFVPSKANRAKAYRLGGFRPIPTGAAVSARPSSDESETAGSTRAKAEPPMAWTTDWTTRAACRGSDPDALFVQGAAQNRAKAVCFGCPVRAECLADALDNRVEFGVWGGLTERERRALLRRRPNVTSWRRLLQAAMDDFERSVAERYSA